MTKSFFSLLLLCVHSLLVNAQDIEHYKNLAETTSNVSEKLTALDSVISKSYRQDDDVFVEYSLRFIDLAKEMDSIEQAARKAMRLQAVITNRKNQPEKAVTIINGIIAHKYKIRDSFLLGGLYLKRGNANFKINLRDAIDDFTLALENFGVKDSLYKADAYLFRGQAYSSLGKFVPAGESYKKAYEYFEALEDYAYMVHSQQGITTMFSMNGFYDKAKEERDKIIVKLKELGLNNYLVVEYYNQALDYKKQGDKKRFLENLHMALSILESIPEEDRSIDQLIYVNSKLVEYYSSENDTDNAAKAVLKLSEWIKGVENISSRISYNGAIANFHFALEDYDTAIDYALEKLNDSKSYNYTDAILESYDLLAALYLANGDYQKSVENRSQYTAIKDSVYNRSTANSLAYYQTLYETEKKEKELVAQSASIQLLEKDNQAFKELIIFIIIALVLFFGLLLLYRNRQVLKSKKLLQEKYSQDLLISQEEERLRISKDLHDGLGQRLLLIKNKLLNTGDTETKSMVDETIDEVRAISRALHPFQLQEMGITKAIEYTINQVDENTTLFISSEIENIDNLFNSEQEVNIYRIVQESLSNIIKHAKAEASKVSISKAPNKIVISIKDNGIGFDFSEKYSAVKSLGLKTLMERTKFLNGQMIVQSKKNNGTLIEFQFPVS
ncbi:tetratricopeptide repeat-containing sensor histidine kinase [Constantimarinum furrinae]|uniref:histidine kinase n=1 Tax=Constantimarinum furrinae TaxID=2562285 RepID=A0A7G8PTS1_9FLAO|nr:sensor histidine kinase [Constantimarinum furrinae]QNJ97737.1 Histidine kinase [Constantimarinum furrinae]